MKTKNMLFMKITKYVAKYHTVHENNKVSSVLYNSRLKAPNSMPNSNDL